MKLPARTIILLLQTGTKILIVIKNPLSRSVFSLAKNIKLKFYLNRTSIVEENFILIMKIFFYFYHRISI